MSDGPKPVTGLDTEGHISGIEVTWNLPAWDPLVDHVAIHASSSREVEISPDTLVGKTVYGRFTHQSLGPESVTRYYRAVTVDAAGRRSNPSATVKGTSTESFTVRGRALAQVGEFDSRSLELALAPSGYKEFDSTFPNGVDFEHGKDDPGKDWAYLHPGPMDDWSGPEGRTFLLRFALDSVPQGDVGIAIWLIDTHGTDPGTATITVNDSDAVEVEFEAGATRGSLEGDATVPGTALVPSFVERKVPARHFVEGSNTIGIVKTDGSWHAYDAVGVFDL